MSKGKTWSCWVCFAFKCINLHFDPQPDLRDPPSAYPAVAAESLHRRGARQETPGAYPSGTAERPAASHRDGATLPRTGRHHRQGQAAGGSAGRGGELAVQFCCNCFFTIVPCVTCQSQSQLWNCNCRHSLLICSRWRTEVTLFGWMLWFCLQVNEGDSEDTDLQIFCVSCSHPINPKVALRHMERCYAKVIISFLLFLCLLLSMSQKHKQKHMDYL